MELSNGGQFTIVMLKSAVPIVDTPICITGKLITKRCTTFGNILTTFSLWCIFSFKRSRQIRENIKPQRP
ncbi:hypothetical protein TPHV1_40207 [Treponema phagedenis]|uniref:Uncharacterized protein n=1 Tax=Treponema phagedenis TaxID=162 RepID=A0A0B7GVJ1_TREPH|nr:hypothetical protein TPHV1_40207 [Treponema phagedenis]